MPKVASSRRANGSIPGYDPRATAGDYRFDRRAAGSSKATLKQGRDFLAHVARLFWERRTGGIRHVEVVPRASEVPAAQTRP